MAVRKNNYGPRPSSGIGLADNLTRRQVNRDGPAAAFHPNQPRKHPLPEAKPRRPAASR